MVDLKNTDTANLWYIVGLIATDGNLSPDGRHICITSKDIDFLEDIRDVLGINAKIGRKSSGIERIKKYGILQFSDVSFYRYLIKIGLTPRKSLTIGELLVPKKHFADFVRGVIDGDGNISYWIHSTNKHEQWSLRIVSGSFTFIDWLAHAITKHFKVTGRVHMVLSERKNPLYLVKFGKVATKIILNLTYYPNCLGLKRKKLKATKCLTSENGWNRYQNMRAFNN